MQQKFFEDMTKLFSSAVEAAFDARRNLEDSFRQNTARVLETFGLVKHSDAASSRDTGAMARKENEVLKSRIAELEKQLENRQLANRSREKETASATPAKAKAKPVKTKKAKTVSKPAPKVQQAKAPVQKASAPAEKAAPAPAKQALPQQPSSGLRPVPTPPIYTPQPAQSGTALQSQSALSSQPASAPAPKQKS